jgi:hypothetical protein
VTLELFLHSKETNLRTYNQAMLPDPLEQLMKMREVILPVGAGYDDVV